MHVTYACVYFVLIITHATRGSYVAEEKVNHNHNAVRDMAMICVYHQRL